MSLSGDRPLSVIATEIVRWWRYPAPRAIPFVNAMTPMDTLADARARTAVTLFLRHSGSWKGRKALAIRTELTRMLREARQAA